MVSDDPKPCTKGTEDDIIWEHNLKDKDVDPQDDGVDDLTTEDDPYEDQITLGDWEELFNGHHSVED